MTDKYIELEHPGVLLEEDFLDDLGIKPGTLASSIGVDRTAIKNIIDCKRAITADMSLRLGRSFNIRTGFWFNLQKCSAWLPRDDSCRPITLGLVLRTN